MIIQLLCVLAVIMLLGSPALSQQNHHYHLGRASTSSEGAPGGSDGARPAAPSVVVPPAPIIVRKRSSTVIVPGGAAANPKGYSPKFEEQPAAWSSSWSNVEVSSEFGYRRDPFTGRLRFHAGVDLRARLGDPIGAGQDGIVRFAGWYHGYGNLVIIDHGDGISTRYGHLSSFATEAGQQVARGEVIGYAGRTGRATSPHLHYEVRVNGKPVNPAAPILLDGDLEVTSAPIESATDAESRAVETEESGDDIDASVCKKGAQPPAAAPSSGGRTHPSVANRPKARSKSQDR